MYHSHAFVPWTFCLQMCTVLGLSPFLGKKEKAVSVVDVVSVPEQSAL